MPHRPAPRRPGIWPSSSGLSVDPSLQPQRSPWSRSDRPGSPRLSPCSPRPPPPRPRPRPTPPRPSAQSPPRRPTPNDTLKSTEVAPDKKVTFRIYAPKADEVSVGGDFGGGGKMTKDDQGVWSLTVGPLTPDFYSYTFTVDGVRVVDPKNPLIKQGVSSLESMVLVPGEEAEFEATKDVPHGEVRAVWYR